MKLHNGMLIVMATLLLGACAANPATQQRTADRVADIQAAAGKPVSSFTYTTTLYSWEPLNEHLLLIYTRPRQAWLLNVGLCPDLPYTVAIGVTSHVGQVSTGIDSVLTHGGQFPCRIQRIQPVDVAQLHARQEQRRKVQAVPRSKAPSQSQ